MSAGPVLLRRLLPEPGVVTAVEALDGVAFAGVAKYPARVKCALLSWMAFKDATARAVAQEVQS